MFVFILAIGLYIFLPDLEKKAYIDKHMTK